MRRPGPNTRNELRDSKVNHRKKDTMSDFQHDDSEECRRRNTTRHRTQPEWAAQAVSARVEDWASDRMLDPGDAHDKGEPSLCVGEAA